MHFFSINREEPPISSTHVWLIACFFPPFSLAVGTCIKVSFFCQHCVLTRKFKISPKFSLFVHWAHHQQRVNTQFRGPADTEDDSREVMHLKAYQTQTWCVHNCMVRKKPPTSHHILILAELMDTLVKIQYSVVRMIKSLCLLFMKWINSNCANDSEKLNWMTTCNNAVHEMKHLKSKQIASLTVYEVSLFFPPWWVRPQELFSTK